MCRIMSGTYVILIVGQHEILSHIIAILVQNICSEYMSDSVRTIGYIRIFCTYLRMHGRYTMS